MGQNEMSQSLADKPLTDPLAGRLTVASDTVLEQELGQLVPKPAK
jgi:hypothetical protein